MVELAHGLGLATRVPVTMLVDFVSRGLARTRARLSNFATPAAALGVHGVELVDHA